MSPTQVHYNTSSSLHHNRRAYTGASIDEHLHRLTGRAEVHLRRERYLLPYRVYVGVYCVQNARGGATITAG